MSSYSHFVDAHSFTSFTASCLSRSTIKFVCWAYAWCYIPFRAFATPKCLLAHPSPQVLLFDRSGHHKSTIRKIICKNGTIFSLNWRVCMCFFSTRRGVYWYKRKEFSRTWQTETQTKPTCRSTFKRRSRRSKRRWLMCSCGKSFKACHQC